MLKKQIFFLVVLICQIVPIEAVNELEKECDRLSFFSGYLFMSDLKQRVDMPLNVDQIIEGIKACSRGEKVAFIDEEQFEEALCALQEHMYLREAEANLKLAENFLQEVSKQKEIVELVKDKLYYKTIQEGEGPSLAASSMLITYSLSTATPTFELELLDSESTPLKIELKNTISGLSKGLRGIKDGEKRIIYIHPDFAFGESGRLDPNLLLIFEVQAIPEAQKLTCINTKN